MMKAVALGLILVAASALQAAETQSATAESIDHAGIIKAWNAESFRRGEELYKTVCITCHGTPTQAGTLPTSRPFWKEPFKNGGDPLSMYRTLTDGFGQMPAWPFLTPEQRYDAIHYVREAFVKPLNPGAYFKVTDEYLTKLPKGSGRGEKTEAMREFEKGPKYLRMDFGPALFWTLEVASNNIAYKGIAVRLDDGPGGVSKGHAWMVYDHDTMRVAAAWTGDKFVDWRGIAFDGSHQTHTKIMGDVAFVNPVGPGCANPATESWNDPRLRGRDDKPYGPLPREWAHYEGTYYFQNRVAIAYSIGDAHIIELPAYVKDRNANIFFRTFNIGKSSHDLLIRLAPETNEVSIQYESRDRSIKRPSILTTNYSRMLLVPADSTPIQLQATIGIFPLYSESNRRDVEFVLPKRVDAAVTVFPTSPSQEAIKFTTGFDAWKNLTNGGPQRWNPPIVTRGKLGTNDGPFAIDELTPPDGAANPWQSWMRFGGFDFFADGKRAAICTWNGDVWTVDGVDGDLSTLTWRRIATGLFQPLGLKIVDEVIYVTCRDQIARLRDLNGDGEIDFVENFNNDHQVTEHFHEFAMGLQTDREGNFYYAKSARHALPAVVPHHGTLLKVSKDGSRTEIIANGFRAANGVCVNEDGTFFVTDQEGHWTPKNRINLVKPGHFYGNMFGYTDQTSAADADMEQPLVWITNDMDRSPGELVRVTSKSWGALNGSLVNLSYGTGRIFVVPYETINGQPQGGVVQLPMPDFPTGVMRGRFHPNGQLYACGLYGWAGNRQADGSFYRVRATGKPAYLPVDLHARVGSYEIKMTDAVDHTSAADPSNYAVKIWSLERTANYGSKHINEHSLKVASARASADGKSIVLAIPDLVPTWGMEIKMTVRTPAGEAITRTIHNTIHQLPPAQL